MLEDGAWYLREAMCAGGEQQRGLRLARDHACLLLFLLFGWKRLRFKVQGSARTSSLDDLLDALTQPHDQCIMNTGMTLELS